MKSTEISEFYEACNFGNKNKPFLSSFPWEIHWISSIEKKNGLVAEKVKDLQYQQFMVRYWYKVQTISDYVHFPALVTDGE